MRKLLIEGILATGKTCLGEYLRTSHDYRHFDYENSAGRKSFNRNAKSGFRQIETTAGVVVTWGFSPWPASTTRVKQLMASGFAVVWLDGDREVARRTVIRRGDKPVWEFDLQVTVLNERKVVEKIQPVVLDPFLPTGDFRPQEELIREISRLCWHENA